MMRFTTYLLLAAFLQLQTQCCHCAHDHAEQPLANGAAQHQHGDHHSDQPGPCDECQLCRLSQQSFLGAAELPTLDPPAVAEVIAPQNWALDLPARLAVTDSSTRVEPRLVECGSLLRI